MLLSLALATWSIMLMPSINTMTTHKPDIWSLAKDGITSEVLHSLNSHKQLKNEVNAAGFDVLMIACQYNHPTLVWRLINECDFPITRQNHQGQTALRIALNQGHHEVALILFVTAMRQNIQFSYCCDSMATSKESQRLAKKAENLIKHLKFSQQKRKKKLTTAPSSYQTPVFSQAEIDRILNYELARRAYNHQYKNLFKKGTAQKWDFFKPLQVQHRLPTEDDVKQIEAQLAQLEQYQPQQTLNTQSTMTF